MSTRTGKVILDRECKSDPDATISLDETSTVAGSKSGGGIWAELFTQRGTFDALRSGIERFAADKHTLQLSEALADQHIGQQFRAAAVRYWRARLRGANGDEVSRIVLGDGPDHREAKDGLLYLAKRLGTQSAPIERLYATAELIGWGANEDTDGQPVFKVELGGTFQDQDREQRRKVLRLLRILARNSLIVVVGTPIDLRWLVTAHDLEETTLIEQWNGRGELPGSPPSVQERAELALSALSEDATGLQILQLLHDHHSPVMSYKELSAALEKSTVTVSNWVRNRNGDALEQLGLVQTFSVGRETHVELTPAGTDTLELFREKTTVQETLDAYSAEALSNHLFQREHGRETTRTKKGPYSPDCRRKGEGLARVVKMSHPQAVGAIASTAQSGLSVVDYPVPEADDYRVPALRVENDTARVVVSAEYVNPMQYWVSTARALTDFRVFDHCLTKTRLSDSTHRFSTLFDNHREELRESRCLGYLSDDIEDVEGYVDALRDARRDLEAMTSALVDEEYDNKSQFRGAITREALGLAGTMFHLFDLVDVDVVREVRLPNFSGDFDRERWTDLTKTLAIGAAIQSEYREHSVYRQLYEDREEKLKWTDFVSVDAANPTGDLLGSFVLVGNFGGKGSKKRDAFVEDLAREFGNPAELRDDAPEFGVDVPIQDFESHREQHATATALMCRSKDLRPNSKAVSLFSLFTDTAYDTAAAFQNLSPEDGREIRVAEVREALAGLPASRLFPSASSGVQDTLQALLAADAPLHTNQLTDAADIECSTLTGGDEKIGAGNKLIALGLVSKSEDCEWRLELSFNTDDERQEDIRPEFLTEESPVEYVRDVLFEAVVRLADRFGFEERGTQLLSCWQNLDPDGLPILDRVLDVHEWLEPWVSRLEITLKEPFVARKTRDQDSRICARLGPEPQQQPIQSPSPRSTAAD